MAEDKKGLRDQVLKTLLNSIGSFVEDKLDQEGDGDGEPGSPNGRIDFRTAKELLSMLAGWAGKGKDEVVQVLCREIGVAVASVVREPMNQVLENRKLQITLELVPKAKGDRPIGKAPKKGSAKT